MYVFRKETEYQEPEISILEENTKLGTTVEIRDKDTGRTIRMSRNQDISERK